MNKEILKFQRNNERRNELLKDDKEMKKLTKKKRT